MSKYNLDILACYRQAMLGAAIMLAACAFGHPALAGESVLDGGTVRILAVGDPAFQSMQKVQSQLEAQAGGKIDLHVVDFDTQHQQALLNFLNKVSKYDIISVEASQFGEYRSHLLDLTPLIHKSGMSGSDFQQPAWDGTTYDGKHLGIPIQPHEEILAYRKDLFAEAGLQPPRTTSELLADAKKLNNWKPGLAGVCWNAARGTPLGQTFLFTMADYHQPIIDLAKEGNGFDIQNIKPSNMKPMINSPAGYAAADFLKQLTKYSPPGILDMAWDERVRVFNQGGCAMVYVWSGRTALWSLDPNSKVHGKVGYVPSPPGPGFPPESSLGGWFLAIPANIEKDRIPLAWRTIEWLTSRKILTLLTEHGDCVAPRHSMAADPAVLARCPVVAAMDRFSREGIFNGWERPPVAELQQIVDIVGTVMHEMLSGTISPQQAVVESQRRVNQMMRQAGYY